MALKYTATDLSNLKAAILTIAKRGAAEVTISGRTIKYTSLKDLQAFIEIVEAEVNGETYGGSLEVEFTGVTN